MIMSQYRVTNKGNMSWCFSHGKEVVIWSFSKCDMVECIARILILGEPLEELMREILKRRGYVSDLGPLWERTSMLANTIHFVRSAFIP